MNNFFRNHYGFILGFFSGIGFCIFAFEAFKPLKNPLLYIGGLGIFLAMNFIYRKLRKETASSSKAGDGKKENKISAA